MRWDVFISHATEDTLLVARPLADALRASGLQVWLDELELTLGDSLRKKIDEGLAKSRYGIVILSHSFFAKEWPQSELDGLVSREMPGHKVVLPVWSGVSRADVERYSPLLAGRLATSFENGLDKTVDAVIRAMSASAGEQSTIVHPRRDLRRAELKVARKQKLIRKAVIVILIVLLAGVTIPLWRAKLERILLPTKDQKPAQDRSQGQLSSGSGILPTPRRLSLNDIRDIAFSVGNYRGLCGFRDPEQDRVCALLHDQLVSSYRKISPALPSRAFQSQESYESFVLETRKLIARASTEDAGEYFASQAFAEEAFTLLSGGTIQSLDAGDRETANALFVLAMHAVSNAQQAVGNHAVLALEGKKIIEFMFKSMDTKGKKSWRKLVIDSVFKIGEWQKTGDQTYSEVIQ